MIYSFVSRNFLFFDSLWHLPRVAIASKAPVFLLQLHLVLDLTHIIQNTHTSSTQMQHVPSSSCTAGPASGAPGPTKSSISVYVPAPNPLHKLTNTLAHQPSYSLLIPTLRGFGPSTHPGDVQTSGTIPDLVADLACVMRAAAVPVATCVGHDWGAQVCWEAARSRPDLMDAVAGAVVPVCCALSPCDIRRLLLLSFFVRSMSPRREILRPLRTSPRCSRI